MCHKIPNFIEKAARAGVNKVFIGLESINPEALEGAQKRQNQLSEYRGMMQAWHDQRVMVFAGYIIGFPGDTPESIVRDVGIIQCDLPVDILEFFILTPLPGSQDHKELFDAGVQMDPDMNNYDVMHVTTAHAQMSADEWLAAYRAPEHLETLLRRYAWEIFGKHARFVWLIVNLRLLARRLQRDPDAVNYCDAANTASESGRVLELELLDRHATG